MFPPKSDWRPPSLGDLPSWADAKRIGIDIETCDPDLKKLGPSVRRGGFIAGVSFAIEDGPCHYLPFRHGSDNLPEAQVLAYLRDNAKAFKGVAVGANFGYDLDWLEESGIVLSNAAWIRDVQIADPLINELHNSYSLNNIAIRWGIPGKDTDLLTQAAKDYGIATYEMYRLPARLVGPYAEQDAVLPLQLLRRQENMIDELDLWDIYNLESKVQPITVKMRRRGVRIDQDQLAKIEAWTLVEEKAALERVRQATGISIPVGGTNKKSLLVPALAKIGVKFRETPSGQPEVTQAVLKQIHHPVADDIMHARKVEKLRNTFVTSIRRHMVNGRIHCTFNQMRRTAQDGDSRGARFGRMSSEHPNMQQQPARDEFAKMWRAIYIPDHPGEQRWLCADFSQQEPRMLTHYAELCGLPRAKEAADRYRNDPSTDNHQMMADMAEIDRDRAKQIYLSLCYGMGGATLASRLGLPTVWKDMGNGRRREIAGKEAQALLDKFNQRAPFIHLLAKRCEDAVRARGCIRTILGRLLHFPMRPDGNGYDWLHKGISRLIQGGSADQMKKSMVDVDAAGFEMQLQVHDELDLSFEHDSEAKQIGEIMVAAVPLNVPSKVDLEAGPNWGAIEKIAGI